MEKWEIVESEKEEMERERREKMEKRKDPNCHRKTSSATAVATVIAFKITDFLTRSSQKVKIINYGNLTMGN